jgi:hypothetical protein
MSAKRDPEEDDEAEYNEDDDEQDEEDDDEDDFIPGADVESEGDEDYDDDQDEEAVPFLDGTLSIDDMNKLHFRGDGFHLQSSTSVGWNLLDRSVQPTQPSCTVEMVGPCDVVAGGDSEGTGTTAPSVPSQPPNRKGTPRKLQVTFTVQEGKGRFTANGNSGKTAGLKMGAEDGGDNEGDQQKIS